MLRRGAQGGYAVGAPEGGAVGAPEGVQVGYAVGAPEGGNLRKRRCFSTRNYFLEGEFV